ncbi:MAG: PD-(D/E)XK nuclease family protein [Gemmatimonadota bacterium]
MPLRIIRSPSSVSLWQAFSEGFLGAIGKRTGPAGYPAFAWFTHRLQRDRLWRDAAAQRLKGWLNPPHAFFSELPRLFAIVERPVGLFEREVLLDRLMDEESERTSFTSGARADRPGLGHAADQVLGDLLPEGVSPEDLTRALDQLGGDEFAIRRNACVVGVYRRYLADLTQRRSYDPRAVHSLIADRIAAGGLGSALGGADRLHIYGITTVRTRTRLLRALAAQPNVDVALYLLGSAGAEDQSEWREFMSSVSDVPGAEPPALVVQPVPDEQREIESIALRIKEISANHRHRLDEIAVVARTGRADARFAYELLERAGVPTTARVRTLLTEVPALVAVRQLLRGVAENWRYRPLRQVLESSYFNLGVDLRPIDDLAAERRIEGLGDWARWLDGMLSRLESIDPDDKAAVGFRVERLKNTIGAFAAFRARLEALSHSRTLPGWIDQTLELLDPGWFDFRRRVCTPDGGRFDLVRLDQQGIKAAETLLRRWRDAEPDAEPLSPDEWHWRFERFLSRNEITLATPRRTGVQVVEAHEAALLPFAHTFIIHANDGEFPKRSLSGLLFTDDERRALAGVGIPFSHRSLTLERERALWRSVTSGPSTTVTYRTANANGVPLLPSLLVPPHDRTSEIPRTRFVWDKPFTRHFVDRAAVERLGRSARAGAPRVTASDPLLVKLAVLRAYAESRRLGSPDGIRPSGELGPWNGQLRDPAVLAVLAEKFGPKRLWSPSQLETWTQNPFNFLVGRVLYLDEQVEADEDTNVMVQGNVAHRMLELFFQPAKTGIPSLSRFDAIAEQVFKNMDAEGEWLGLPHLWNVRREGVRRMVKKYLEWELAHLKGCLPEMCELGFGDGDKPPVAIHGIDLLGTGVTMLLRGRIDRVDLCTTKNVLQRRILDYKSGQTPTPKGYEDGAALQGPLYLAALASLGIPAVSFEYRSLKNCGSAAKIKHDDPVSVAAIQIALTVPSYVRLGRFEPAAARSTEWKPYWAGGLALYRTQSVLGGSRFA